MLFEIWIGYRHKKQKLFFQYVYERFAVQFVLSLSLKCYDCITSNMVISDSNVLSVWKTANRA